MRLANSVKKAFSRSPGFYHEHAAVQRQIASDLLFLIPKALAPRRILEVGSGTGLLTGLLLEKFPGVKIHAIDISSSMIEFAQENLPGAVHVNWILGDICEFEASEPYDLVISSAALHWVSPLQDALSAVRRCVQRDGGEFVASFMIQGTLQELHTLRAELFPEKPALTTLPSVEAVQACCRNAEVEVNFQEERKYIQEFANSGEFIRSVNRMGLTGRNVSLMRNSPLSRGELLELEAQYNARFRGNNGRVFASYQTLMIRGS